MGSMGTLDAGNWIAILIAVVGVAAAWGGYRHQLAGVSTEVKSLTKSIEKLGARIGEAERTLAAYEERITHIADSVGLRADIRRMLAQAGVKRRPSQAAIPLPAEDDESGGHG